MGKTNKVIEPVFQAILDISQPFLPDKGDRPLLPAELFISTGDASFSMNPSSPQQKDEPDPQIQRDLEEMAMRNSLANNQVSAEEAAFNEHIGYLNEAASQPYNRDNLSLEELSVKRDMLENVKPYIQSLAEQGVKRDLQIDLYRNAMMSGKYGPPKRDLNEFIQGLTMRQQLEILDDPKNILRFPYDKPLSATWDNFRYLSYDNLERYKKIQDRNYEMVRTVEDELDTLKQAQYFVERKKEFDALPYETKTAIWEAAQMRSELDQEQHRTPLLLKSSIPVNQVVQLVKGTPFKLVQCFMAEQSIKNLPGYNKNLYEYAKLLANIETSEQNLQKDEEAAEKDPWLSTYKSILEKPSAAVDSLAGTMKTELHNWTSDDNMPVDLNDAYHANNQSVKVSRETVAKKIQEVTGVEMLGDVYTMGTSVADGLLVAPLSAVSPVIPAVILGTEAAADTAEDIVRRGGNADQAVLGSVISFTANTAFNLFSFGDLQALSQTSVAGVKDVFRNLITSAFVNLSEDSISWAVDQLADQLVMGDLSRYNQAVQGYMRNGLSRQAAERQAGWDMARDLTQTAVQGGVRGIAFSAGGMAYGSGRQRSRGSYDVNDMAARAANGQIAGDGASRVDPSFTDTDLEIAEILQEDAPRKPFTDEVDSGIVEREQAQLPVEMEHYKAPPGGGGVTVTIELENQRICFGHGGRHLEGTNLSMKDVNQAIAKEVAAKKLRKAEFCKCRIIVHGVTIEYTSFGLGDGVVKVGTYYIVKQEAKNDNK